MPPSQSSDLVFIRVPKTGSTSLMNSLNAVIDANKGTSCLSGSHVPASVYASHPHDHRLLTLVRDPLQMYCSFYWFMRKRVMSRDYKSPLAITPYHADNMRLLVDGVSLEEFLLTCPPNQVFPYYYDTVPVSEYFWVGSVDDMQSSMVLLNKMTGIDTSRSMAKSNENSLKASSGVYSVSPDTDAEFKARNNMEYEIYEAAVGRLASLKAASL